MLGIFPKCREVRPRSLAFCGICLVGSATAKSGGIALFPSKKSEFQSFSESIWEQRVVGFESYHPDLKRRQLVALICSELFFCVLLKGRGYLLGECADRCT